MAASIYAPERESLVSVYASEAPFRRDELATWKGPVTPKVRFWTYVYENLDLMDAVTTLSAHVAPRGGPGFDVGGVRFGLADTGLRPLELSHFLYEPVPPHRHSSNVVRFMAMIDVRNRPRGFFSPFPETLDQLLGFPWLPGLLGLSPDPDREAAYIANVIFEVANNFERDVGKGLLPSLVEFVQGRALRNRARLGAILQGVDEARVLQPFLAGPD